MSKFAHLKALDVSKDTTARYTLHQIAANGRTPTLIVRPATPENAGYFSEVLKRSGSSARRVRAGRISEALISENRDDDRRLFALYVVAGWEDVVDGEGAEVPFSPEDATDLLKSLPNWVFDELRDFCGNIENFVSTLDAEAVAGN